MDRPASRLPVSALLFAALIAPVAFLSACDSGGSGQEADPPETDPETTVEQTTATLGAFDNTDPTTESTVEGEASSELSTGETVAPDSLFFEVGSFADTLTSEREVEISVPETALAEGALTAELRAKTTRGGTTETGRDGKEVTFEVPRPSINAGELDLSIYEDRPDTQSVAGLVENGTLESIAVTEGPATADIAPDSSLVLDPSEDQFGEYTLTITAQNENGTTEVTEEGTVQGLADITGQVVEGTTRGQIQAQYRLTGGGATVVEGTTDMQGNFSFQLPPDAETDSLRFTKDNFFGRVVPFSYQANNVDTSDVKEAMFSTQPGRDIGWSPEKTKEFVEEAIYSSLGQGGSGYRFWPTKPQNIGLKRPELTGDSLSTEDLDRLRQVFDEINQCTGRNFQMQVNEPGDTSGVDVFESSIVGEQGNIAIYRDNEQGSSWRTGLDEETTLKGLIDRGLVTVSNFTMDGARQDLYETNMGVSEVGSKFNPKSILVGNNRDISTLGPADCQVVPYFRGEDYTQGDPLIGPLEPVNNVLRLEE